MPLTSAEIAAFTGVDEARVRKEVEHGLFGTTSPPRFEEPALVYFGTLKLLDIDLGPKDREKLYGAIRSKVSAKHRSPETLKLGEVLEVRVGKVVRNLRHLVRDFTSWKKRLVVDDDILGGEPSFPRTRLSVRHIGQLLERGGADEVSEDYPDLSKKDLEYARLFVAAYPRRGRPLERREARP